MNLDTAVGSIVRAAVIVLGLAVVPQSVVMLSPAHAAEPALQAEGSAAVAQWLKAVTSGDQATIGGLLAPEFQIVRSDGSVYDRAGYLAGGLPVITSPPHVEDLVVTAQGDTMVTSYVLTIGQTRGGKTAEARAPRLTVFRKSGDQWLVVAHGNFASLQP